MILIKNVLVATDFSEPSGAALNYGRELARFVETASWPVTMSASGTKQTVAFARTQVSF